MEKETKHTPERFSITDNLTAVINNQADRIIEAENSGKALLRIIERLEGQISEMKKENTSLKSEIEKFRDEFKCHQCMGHGWFQSNNGNQPTQDQCHVCYGTGTLGRGYFQSEIDRLQTELSEMKKEREELVQALEEIALAYDNGYVFNKRITVIKTLLSRIKK